MRDSVAIIERLHATAHLLSKSIGYDCVIVGPENEVALELPPNHVNTCFCKRIEALTGQERSLNHFFSRCDRISKDSEGGSYAIYHCPYGLANVIVPAFDGKQFVAALQIGPIMTSDTDKLLLEQGLLTQGTYGDKIDGITKFLDKLPRASVSHILSIAKLAASLISDDDLTFKSHSMEADIDNAEANLDLSDDIVCSIQQYIVENFTDNDMSLDMVAKHVYVHASYISRIFSQQFNTPFRTYINGLRVNLASELLDTTDKSIGDICHEVGFSDHSYFNRVFKSIRGLTPSEYRNRPRD